MSRNLVSSLFLHGRVVTTEAKAKEYRGMAEKLITLAKEKNLHRVRRAAQVLGNKDAVRVLFDEIGPSMKDRPGGYTRIIKLGPRRGDNAEMALIELVDSRFESGLDEGGDEAAESSDAKKGQKAAAG